MVTIGTDPHKDSHVVVAVDQLGKQLSTRRGDAVLQGFGELLEWARDLDPERVWVIEDCRHVSGPFERFLLDHGEQVARLAPHMTALGRSRVPERGKSDPVDALAIARAALAHGIENLPTAQLAGKELEIRLLHRHHQRLVKQRTALINELRWNLYDLDPEFKLGARQLIQTNVQTQVARRLQRMGSGARAQVARDEIKRIRELTTAIRGLRHDMNKLVSEVAPQLLDEVGFGPISAAALIGEIAGIERFRTDAQLARMAGCAPIPVSSGRSDHYRLDRGGNRHLNTTIHGIAITRLKWDPESAAYVDRLRSNGKTRRAAIRCLKRQLVRRIWHLMTDPTPNRVLVC